MHDEIKRLLRENFTTGIDGVLRMARRTTRSRPGDEVGHMMPMGYLAVTVPTIRKKVYVHQVVYFLQTGVWAPEFGLEIDHRNRVRTDNRPVNLRLATTAGNARNKGALHVSSYMSNTRTKTGTLRYRVQMKTGYGFIGISSLKCKATAFELADLLKQMTADAAQVPCPAHNLPLVDQRLHGKFHVASKALS